MPVKKTRALAIAEAKENYNSALESHQERKSEEIEAKFADYPMATIYLKMLGQQEHLTAKQQRFLGVLCIIGVVSTACRIAECDRSSITLWQKQPHFLELYNEAINIATDRLEEIAIHLATGQFTKPVVSMGKVVAYEQIYDTKLLQFILKGRRPNVYGNKVDITSNGHSIVKLIDREAWDAV